MKILHKCEIIAYICNGIKYNSNNTMSNLTNNTSIQNTSNELKDFIGAYGMVPASKQVEFRDKLMFDCDWKTEKTFHQKRKGDVKVTKPEAMVICSAFATLNIDAHTGEYIKQLQD